MRPVAAAAAAAADAADAADAAATGNQDAALDIAAGSANATDSRSYCGNRCLSCC